MFMYLSQLIIVQTNLQKHKQQKNITKLLKFPSSSLSHLYLLRYLPKKKRSTKIPNNQWIPQAQDIAMQVMTMKAIKHPQSSKSSNKSLIDDVCFISGSLVCLLSCSVIIAAPFTLFYVKFASRARIIGFRNVMFWHLYDIFKFNKL